MTATFLKVSPETAAIEKAAIKNIYAELEKVKASGHDNWQTLTNLISNLLVEFDQPFEVLQLLHEHVELKINRIRQMKAN